MRERQRKGAGCNGAPALGDSRAMPTLTRLQEELAAGSRWDFSDLRALFINCTLKRSPELSNTQGLADIADRDHGAQRRDRATSSAPSTTTSRPACSPT